ncbi:MAG: hypothetical protein AABZ60_24145 [Planctomycetota bacterium]
MELRPPMILIADNFEIQENGSLNLIGIRHIFESDTFPLIRSVAVYCFLGTLREQEIEMGLYLESHQTKEETLLMNSVVETQSLAIPAIIPQVTFAEPGFYSFQLRVQKKLYAWSRIQVKKSEPKKSS